MNLCGNFFSLFFLQNDFLFFDSAYMGISLSYLLIIDLYSYDSAVLTPCFAIGTVDLEIFVRISF